MNSWATTSGHWENETGCELINEEIDENSD
jgi:hypothetical protein